MNYAKLPLPVENLRAGETGLISSENASRGLYDSSREMSKQTVCCEENGGISL
jgi:hypothetical protein